MKYKYSSWHYTLQSKHICNGQPYDCCIVLPDFFGGKYKGHVHIIELNMGL